MSATQRTITISRFANDSLACASGWLLAAIIVVSCTISSAQGRDTIAPIIGNAADSVVKLYGKSAGREHGYGTGVLVSSDGRIVTTLSLMVSLSGVKAVLSDGSQFNARLERVDETRQLALLKIEGAKLPHLTPQPSAHLSQGDTVIALGNWFKIAEGHEAVSVCKGILSLRTLLEARRLAQDFDYQGEVLIIDAITANPGAAGGPLLDADGQFVGLVGKVIESVHTNTRLNYALPGEEIIAFLAGPSDGTARNTSGGVNQPEAQAGDGDQSAASLSDHSKKPYIGVKLARLGYRHVSAYVERVRPGSPAAKVGIQPDDLILAMDGRRIADAEAYEEAVARLLPGQRVQFTIKRGPDILAVMLTVEAEP